MVLQGNSELLVKSESGLCCVVKAGSSRVLRHVTLWLALAREEGRRQWSAA